MAEPAAPLVTVITATHNGAGTLPAAAESILAQAGVDLEYLIIDDQSADATPAIMAGLAAGDRRVVALRTAARRGPAGALNDALALARGAYVAILDHDDLALPGRLARQAAFLAANPAIGAVGGQARLIDAAGATIGRQSYPTEPAVARWNLLFGASLLHSASMYRRALLQRLGGYSERHQSLCDYELLGRLAELAPVANLPEELAAYRRSAGQYSAANRTPQHGQMLLLQYALQLRWLGMRPDLATFAALRGWMFGQPPPAATAAAATELLAALHARYVEVTPLAAAERAAVDRACARAWLKLAHHAYRADRPAARACWRRAAQLDPAATGRAAARAQLRRQ